MNISIHKYENLINSLHQSQLTSIAAAILLDTLTQSNAAIIQLFLGYNEIDDGCMKQLGEFIQDNPYLVKLNMQFNKISDKGIKILSEYLIGNDKLADLDFSGNRSISNSSSAILLDVLKKSAIKNMLLTDTQMTSEIIFELHAASLIPIDKREVPIKSNTKFGCKAFHVKKSVNNKNTLTAPWKSN